MAQDNCQKIKMLKLYELLRQETDEQHPMTTQMIIERLGKMGISCERRTLARDMATLNEYGYEVMSRWFGKEKAYYIEDRSFTVPELKIVSPTLGVTFNNNTGMAHVSSGSKSAQITAQIENGYVDTNSVSLGQAYYFPNTFDQKITTSTLKPENIKKGVVILGVTGTYEG